MSDIFSRLWNNLVGRITGPMNFRLIMQPLVAAGFAIWSGVKDARAGRPAFLWTVITDLLSDPLFSATAGRTSARSSCWR
jgi:hypothetical protein